MTENRAHYGQLQFLVATVAVLIAFYAWRGPTLKSDQETATASSTTSHITVSSAGEKLFTRDQLKLYDGAEGSPGIYIAILGRIYDVEKGRRHYGPGGSYSFFSGRDATNAFISGDFETVSEDLDDVLKLPGRDILAVWNWQKFYEKDYVFVGKLIGRYYDADGQETAYLGVVREEVAREEASNQRREQEKREFPPCNTEWSKEKGSTFWCTDRSGGVERAWVGVPRKMFKPGQSDFSCVCVEASKLGAGNLKEFEGCDPESTKCVFRVEE